MVWYSGFQITIQKCSEQDIEVLRVTQRWCVSMEAVCIYHDIIYDSLTKSSRKGNLYSAIYTVLTPKVPKCAIHMFPTKKFTKYLPQNRKIYAFCKIHTPKGYKSVIQMKHATRRAKICNLYSACPKIIKYAIYIVPTLKGLK